MCVYIKKVLPLHPHSTKQDVQVDSLAQPVEHIPFKDGVLGSNPRRITILYKTTKNPLYKSLFLQTILLFLSTI